MIVNMVNMSRLTYLIKKTMLSWKNLLEKAIDDFKNKGYNINHFEEMDSRTIDNKIDMSYDFYIKHNMCALGKKLNAIVNKRKI